MYEKFAGIAISRVHGAKDNVVITVVKLDKLAGQATGENTHLDWCVEQ